MISCGVVGSRGKTGRQVVSLLQEEFSQDCFLQATANQGESFEAVLKCDMVIDFSHVQGLRGLCEAAQKAYAPLPLIVSGSTGLSEEDKQKLKKLAHKTLVFHTPQFSPGMALFCRFLKEYAPSFYHLGYEPSICEVHHQWKKDAPSGTAQKIEEILARPSSSVPLASLRVGEVLGEHTVSFFGKDDRLVFTHSVQNRALFARQAIQVGLWMSSLKEEEKKTIKTLLTMEDYLQRMTV